MCHSLTYCQDIRHKIHLGLLARIAAQDQEALGELYEETYSLVFSIARKILGNHEAAEEAVQDAYLQIWRRAGDFDPQRGSPLAWMITIVRSRSLDRLRRLSRERLESWQDEESKATTPSPHRSGLRSEVGWMVRSALGQLRIEQRILIEQAFYGGLSHRELAERMGIPLGTIKTRIRSAMQRLRESLQCSGLRDGVVSSKFKFGCSRPTSR